MTNDTAQLLITEARHFNHPDFIAHDPVQFPRMFSQKQDIEIAALLASTIAWGNRTMICRSANKMFGMMEWQPYNYIMDRGYEELPDGNIHRTFFCRNLRHYLRGLQYIYDKYGSLEDFAGKHHVADSATPAWELARLINEALCAANNGTADCRCLPLDLNKSALKRFNMALRWLVRDDGIVDMGIWTAIKPSQLYIPLDVHVGNTSRALGILGRRSNDRRAVIELTDTLRPLCPDDPAIFDFALFGIGITAEKAL